MPTSAFNISRLIAELGLKDIRDIPLVERIQPVLTVGDLTAQTPPHVAPSAIFGELISQVVAENGVFEIQCLSAGGGFVDWISVASTAVNLHIKVRPTAIAASEAIVQPLGLTSRDPILSVARQGTILPSGDRGAVASQSALFMGFAPRSIFVPRGSFFSLEGGTVNSGFFFGVGWREVPASEHVPS